MLQVMQTTSATPSLKLTQTQEQSKSSRAEGVCVETGKIKTQKHDVAIISFCQS